MKRIISNRMPKGAGNWGVCLSIISLVFAFSAMLAPLINAGTFIDDFNDGKADGWVVFEGKWEVVNGEYRAPVEVNKVPYPLTFALDGKEYGEFTIEAKIRNDKFHSTMNQAHAGFAFGMDSKGTGYVLYFRFHKGITCAGGAVVIRRIIENLRGGCDPNADVAEGCDVFKAMDIGNWHTLKAEVSAQNGAIKAWVDGKASIDIKLSAQKLKLDTGKVGLCSLRSVVYFVNHDG